MTPEQIADALGGARRDGRGYVAICPCHDDKHPSLALHAGDDGKLLYHCRAGCSQDAVRDTLAARGLLNGRSRDPNPPRRLNASRAPAAASSPTPDAEPDMHDRRMGEPVDSWCYRDAEGRPTYYVARYETPDGKTIRPWTWDGSRWQQRAHDAPRPLYGLDRLARMPDAPVLLVEGEKCADAAHVALGSVHVCMTWCGGANAVGKSDWSPLHGRRVLVWPDRDDPGRKAAAEIRRVLPDAGVLDVPGSDGWDCADLLEAEGPEAVRRFIDECARAGSSTTRALDTGTAPKPYVIRLARDFRLVVDVAYHIKGIWQKGELGITWGPSGGGKSYVTADMALHVASGEEWCGRRVRRSGVVYLCAEAPASIEQRFIAMCAEKEIDRATIPLATLAGSLHMIRDPDGVIAAITDAACQLREAFGVSDVMLIVDTLARSAPGMDENGPEDMGAYVGVCDRIRLELGMACVVVHHAGKDLTRGARGHSALKAAADSELMIADQQISIEKLRDGATGNAIPFTLHPIELAKDSDGDPITACWVEYQADVAARAKTTKMTPTTTIAFEALREAIQAHGEPMPQTSTLPGGKASCTIEQWRTRFYGRTSDREPEAQKKAFRRAKDDLVARKIIGTWETRAWIWGGTF